MTRSVSFRVFVAVGFALGVTALGAFVVRLSAGELSPEWGAGAYGKARVPLKEWRLVDQKHWQVVGAEPEDPRITDKLEGTRGDCGDGQVEVKGNMKADPERRVMFDPNTVEEMQKRTCTKWIQKEYPERCAEFDKDKWLEMSKGLPTKPMHYCMDRFEYPNKKGAFPIIFVTFYEAEDKCKSEGKRLCNEDEWTFACEGEEATPYPYGYTRSPDICPIDGKWRAFNGKAMTPRDAPEAMIEMDRLFQGVASGSKPDCKSKSGVYDLTGNIDEWTTSVREGERPSILKGGYWGPVRTRCRPATRSHDQNHAFYQQGFRCCSDAPKTKRVDVPDESAPRTNLDPSRDAEK